jgi:hypothetical protein
MTDECSPLQVNDLVTGRRPMPERRYYAFGGILLDRHFIAPRR